MSIISFWTEDIKETGQTSVAIAVATQMAIQHNKKILLISTYANNKEFDAAFWKPQVDRKNLLSFLNLNKKVVGLESGVEGLMKIEGTNKLTPNLITDYTGIIFKDRLEILSGYNGVPTTAINDFYVSLIKKATMAYDIVIVDLPKGINQLAQDILTISDVVVYGITQKRHSIDEYMSSRKDGYTAKMNNLLVYIGRYDKFSKYTQKNISRTTRNRDMLYPVVYNTLFSDACDEGVVVDYFLRMQTVTDKNRNTAFVDEIKDLIKGILFKIDEVLMKR